MTGMQLATRGLDCREDDFCADAGTDPDVAELCSETDALLIEKSQRLTELVARLAAVISRSVVEESQSG